MKKTILEVFVSALLVLVPTFFIYRRLESIESFWNTQFLWSAALILCWIIVAVGYYHQGWLVRSRQRTDNVSVVLPVAVFPFNASFL